MLSKTLVGHSSFVGPLAWIAPCEKFPEGRIVSGGIDTVVLLWDLKTGQSVQTLKGHQLQVTGLAVDDNDIISSSIDWYFFIISATGTNVICSLWSLLTIIHYNDVISHMGIAWH